MLNYYKILLFIISLFIAGCTNYIVTDFPAKKQFHDKFNILAKDKNIETTFKDRSKLCFPNGGFIRNDSLFLINYFSKDENITLPLAKIKNIIYLGINSSFQSANILSVDQKHYNAKNIRILNDSINFINVYTIDKSIPIYNITEITFKNRWQGMYYGLAIGTAVGLLSGYLGIFPPYKNVGWDNYFNERVAPKFIKLSIFPVVGIILGYILGYNYTYQFNP